MEVSLLNYLIIYLKISSSKFKKLWSRNIGGKNFTKIKQDTSVKKRIPVFLKM